MSDSRLEKFIYAICSMDVSDLPVPLSRIEKLWNCLITGETPDFEPLSRNEKYLMAMLDRYDISNLPAPMSRGEKLLYKIAVGETDLSDVPGYLSRYEELLKYLIENGGISGGDFEYVLYTLNQSLNTLYLTAEKPVKSAILKGNTMKNIIGDEIFMDAGTSSITNITDLRKNYLIPTVKIATNYLVMYELEGDKIEGADASNLVTAIGFLNHNSGWSSNFEQQPLKGKLIINSGNNPNYFRVVLNNKGYSKLKSVKINVIEYEEYMNDFDIPYFEGMQSVKMPVLTTTGKNLFDSELEVGGLDSINGGNYDEQKDRIRTKSYIKVKPNTSYILSRTNYKDTWAVRYYDENYNHISPHLYNNLSEMEIKTGANVHYIRIVDLTNDLSNLYQVEEGKVATEYEPFKSNILTVNEEVELRGIGDVQDKLDCLTGEVTESIGEIVLDGTQYMASDGYGVYIQVDDVKRFLDYTDKIACDKLPVIPAYQELKNVENGISGFSNSGAYLGQNWLYVKINNSVNTDEVKEWLTQNPITVQYELATESVKTVDLTVVDQDNQPTQLGTFENVTHVSLEAENLIPEVEMEVATNLLEDMVFTLTDAFNTLYPTAAKPVKSAILKGQTLVNISSLSGEIIIKPGSNNFIDSPLIKQNTTYTFMFNCTSAPSTGFIEIRQVFSNAALKIENINVVQGYNKFKLTTVNKEVARFRLKNESTSETDFVFNNLLILEGDYTNQDISYFEGMQSVKMPVLTTIGKNLFDKTKITTDKLIVGTGAIITSTGNAFTDYIPVEAGKTYIRNIAAATIAVYDTDKNFIERTKAETTFSATANGYIRWNFNSYASVLDTMQIEEGSTKTSYEPYQSNILSTSEEVTLRGIGDVRDTLDCLTRELTQRIGEVVLDGTQDGVYDHATDESKNILILRLNKIPDIKNDGSNLYGLVSDKYISTTNKSPNNIIAYNTRIMITKPLSELELFNTSDKIKSFLAKNPITLQYPLATESVKTVDLTVVDQDGNVTTLETFDDTTHVLLESEGLIPTAALTVRTKIPSASSTSLLMNDISTKQEQLETTVDEQSENVDATMIATTEIFEETL